MLKKLMLGIGLLIGTFSYSQTIGKIYKSDTMFVGSGVNQKKKAEATTIVFSRVNDAAYMTLTHKGKPLIIQTTKYMDSKPIDNDGCYVIYLGSEIVGTGLPVLVGLSFTVNDAFTAVAVASENDIVIFKIKP